MFTLLVCADLYDTKVNLEFSFDTRPDDVSELTRDIEKVLNQEAVYLRPPDTPASEVKVVRIQIYDDANLNWMDLVSSSQLHEYDQLYVFQPPWERHVDLQEDLPAPRPPSTGPVPPSHQPGSVDAVAAHSSCRGVGAKPAGPVVVSDDRANIPHVQKLENVGDMLTLLVCADVYGNKVNLELPFDTRPDDVSELTRDIEKVLNQEAIYLRPPRAAAAEVKVSRIQIYDDAIMKWMDLANTAQLHEYDQLYVRQPPSVWHTDVQADLSPPRPPSTGPVPPPRQPGSAPPAVGAVGRRGKQLPSEVGAKPAGSLVVSDERANIPHEQKVQAVFREIDGQQRGWIDFGELESAFSTRGLPFSSNTIQELFCKGDINHDGRIDRKEWVSWAAVYPNTLEVMYYRGRDTADKEMPVPVLEDYEPQLLESEIRLERCRDQLRAQLSQCFDMEQSFNTGAAGHGSDRRAVRLAYGIQPPTVAVPPAQPHPQPPAVYNGVPNFRSSPPGKRADEAPCKKKRGFFSKLFSKG